MRLKRKELQEENKTTIILIRELFDQCYECNHLEKDKSNIEEEKSSWRRVLIEVLQQEIDYKNKLSEQMVRLLRSLNIRKTREEIQNFRIQDIEDLKAGRGEGDENDWNQVLERIKELTELDEFSEFLKTEMSLLDKPRPAKTKTTIQMDEEPQEEEVPDLDFHQTNTTFNTTFQALEKSLISFVSDPMDFLKGLKGSKWRIAISIMSATIFGLVVIVIYGIVNAANNQSNSGNIIPLDDASMSTVAPLKTTTPCIASSPDDIC